MERIEKGCTLEDWRSAEKAVLTVSGLGCVNCVNRVRNSLVETEGVVWAEIDLEDSRAYVAYDGERLTVPDLQRAVSAAGRGNGHRYGVIPIGSF